MQFLQPTKKTKNITWRFFSPRELSIEPLMPKIERVALKNDDFGKRNLYYILTLLACSACHKLDTKKKLMVCLDKSSFSKKVVKNFLHGVKQVLLKKKYEIGSRDLSKKLHFSAEFIHSRIRWRERK